MAEKFNQNKYITEYQKSHYKQFKVNLKIEDMNELDKILKKCNMTKTQFIKNAIEELKRSLKKQ